MNLGTLLTRTGRVDEALRLYAAVLRADPANPDAMQAPPPR